MKKIMHYSLLAFLYSLWASQPAADVNPLLSMTEEIMSFEQRMQHPSPEILQQLQDPNLQCRYQDGQYLYRIHRNAYYYSECVSALGDYIQLQDTSLWEVHPNYRLVIQKWYSDDPIFIKPNPSRFSPYRYILQNRKASAQDIAEVNLKKLPIEAGGPAFWIAKIDFEKSLVKLNDDTLWRINPHDYSFNKWRVEDRVLIGVNNNWRFAHYPHILINASMTNTPYCEADINY